MYKDYVEAFGRLTDSQEVECMRLWPFYMIVEKNPDFPQR